MDILIFGYSDIQDILTVKQDEIFFSIKYFAIKNPILK